MTPDKKMKRRYLVKRTSIRIALTLAIAGSLGGCTVHSIHSGGDQSYPPRNEVPIASNFSTSTQLKLQAAEHWRRVAADTASALVKPVRAGTTLYLRRNCDTTGCAPRACDTTFNRVFHNEFLSALVDLGYKVSNEPLANAAVVDIDVQSVAFARNRPQYRYAGEAVEIGPGTWALRDHVSLIDKVGAAAMRTEGTDAHWYRAEFAAGATPRNELVITVSAMAGDKTYLSRSTRVYYTADSDAALYSCGETSGARTWSIPVSGDCTGPRCLDPDRRR